MKPIRLITGAISVNTYILPGINGRAVVIDPGGEAQRIERVLADYGLSAEYVVLTHGHFDHCNAAAHLQKSGAKVVMHKNDIELLQTDKNLAERSGVKFNDFLPDFTIKHKETVMLSGLQFHVQHTPGHTEGSISLIQENRLFTGDTLFYLSVGRTDLPTGNPEKLRESLALLFALGVDYPVYPGHGVATRLEFERGHNPYLGILLKI